MPLDKNGIAKRIAQELQDGFYVNLGIGIPTLVANYIPENLEIEFQIGFRILIKTVSFWLRVARKFVPWHRQQ